MGYPFVISYANDEFARVNHDGSWSVDWEKTIRYRFEAMTPRNIPVIAMAVALLAAKDNFWETSWKTSNEWGHHWPHKVQTLDVEESEPEVGSIRANYGLSSSHISVARVNYDGSWSINWPAVVELAREPVTNYKTMAVIAFCQMLVAAKDRFITTPWEIPEANDDDE